MASKETVKKGILNKPDRPTFDTGKDTGPSVQGKENIQQKTSGEIRRTPGRKPPSS